MEAAASIGTQKICPVQFSLKTALCYLGVVARGEMTLGVVALGVVGLGVLFLLILSEK
jgi:hypothetical protein